MFSSLTYLVAAFAAVDRASAEGSCTGCFCETIYLESEMQIESNVQYGSAFNIPKGKQEQLLLNLYMPPTTDPRGFRPAMLSIHGGGFTAKDKDDDNFVHWAKNFVANGFVAVSINYRLAMADTDKTEANAYAMEDAKAAVRWLVKNSGTYRIDVNRIGAFGCSAGAMTVSWLCTQEGEGQSGNPGYPSNITAGVVMSGVLQPEKWGEIKANPSPYLNFHGDADLEIPYAAAVATQEAEREVGMVSELVTMPGKGHCPFGEFERRRSEVMAFLAQHMDLAHAECPGKDAAMPSDVGGRNDDNAGSSGGVASTSYNNDDAGSSGAVASTSYNVKLTAVVAIGFLLSSNV
jgi:dienelactone hydrolase